MKLPPRPWLLVGGLLALPPLYFVAVALTHPFPDRAPGTPATFEVVGALHTHTVASDGGGTLEQLLDAAADEELDFVVLTDHNVRGAPEWTYSDSVLLLVGEEVNTPYGHLLVIGETPVGDRRRKDEEGLPRPRPAPVVVQPEEGLRIAAHPVGRPEWTLWEPGHFDGIEIWNADSERRDDPPGEWAHALSLLPLRPMAALFRLLDRPGRELALFDQLLTRRPVFGVCGVDAHHTLPLTRDRRVDLHFPSYRHSFRFARQHVLLEDPLTGDARTDGRAVLEAIGNASSYCAFDGLADARGATFLVAGAGASGGATLGDTVAWEGGLSLRVTLPPAGEKARTRLVRDGTVIALGDGTEWRTTLPGPGVYRVEVDLPFRRSWRPWILTNPIWVAGDDEAPAGR